MLFEGIACAIVQSPSSIYFVQLEARRFWRSPRTTTSRAAILAWVTAFHLVVAVMAKSARGLSGRASAHKQAKAHAARDRSMQARKDAKQNGITAEDERRLNSEAAAEAAERRTIAKEKRQKRKQAKAEVRSAAETKELNALMQRAQSAAEKERNDRQRAAAAAAAARAAQKG